MNIPLKLIQKEVEIKSSKIAADWNSFCSEVVTRFCEKLPSQIGGLGQIVEIDESKIGKRKNHKRHFVEGQWVFGDVCRETKEVFVEPVEKIDAATLIPLIEKFIAPGSIIHSDFWKSYDQIDSKKYSHKKVNHSKNFKDPKTGTHTNTIESEWRHFKTSIPPYSRKKKNYINYIEKYKFLAYSTRKNIHPT